MPIEFAAYAAAVLRQLGRPLHAPVAVSTVVNHPIAGVSLDETTIPSARVVKIRANADGSFRAVTLTE